MLFAWTIVTLFFSSQVTSHRMTNSLPPQWDNKGSEELRCDESTSNCYFELAVQEWLTMWSGKTPVYSKDGTLHHVDATHSGMDMGGDMSSHSNGHSMEGHMDEDIEKDMNTTHDEHGKGSMKMTDKTHMQSDMDHAQEPHEEEEEIMDPKHVVTADGVQTFQRRVLLYNGQLPGPAIHVYVGQTLRVLVNNLLPTETTTVHWHGLHMIGSPQSDGVPFITQCPILPGQSFVYEFKIVSPGSFWYHSHSGTQRSNGLYGALVIHEPMPTLPPANVPEEHLLLLTEWNHDYDSEVDFLKMTFGFYEGDPPVMWMGNNGVSGARNGMFKFHSGLINGRGRYYHHEGMHNGAPLHQVPVEHGKRYRLRLMNVASTFSFLLSVYEHPLTVIANDGHFVVPQTGQYVIVNPGERLDVLLDAAHHSGNYQILARTLEKDVKHTAEAILNYVGTPVADGDTQTYSCTSSTPCQVINCPFLNFPEDWHMECSATSSFRLAAEHQNYWDYLRSLDSHNVSPDPQPNHNEQTVNREYFLNIGFPGDMNWAPAAINGRSFKSPTVNALYQRDEVDTWCQSGDCGEDRVCHCTHTIQAKYGEIIQIVFTNYGVGSNFTHPMHLHGHHFRVVKIGWPTYDKHTGDILSPNSDISCAGSSYCNSPRWSDPSWANGNLPGVLSTAAPIKDTVMVPAGSYVVIRFRADNPGLWLIHCHVDSHARDGMAVLLDEAYDRVTPSPRGFPTCGSYQPQQEIPVKDASTFDNAPNNGVSRLTFAVTVGVLAGVTLVSLVLVVSLWIKLRRNNGSLYFWE